MGRDYTQSGGIGNQNMMNNQVSADSKISDMRYLSLPSPSFRWLIRESFFTKHGSEHNSPDQYRKYRIYRS